MPTLKEFQQIAFAIREILRNQLSHGGDPIRILGAISWQFRMIWAVKSCQEQGIHSGQITKKIGEHPFAIEKALQCTRRFSNQQLRNCYSELEKGNN